MTLEKGMGRVFMFSFFIKALKILGKIVKVEKTLFKKQHFKNVLLFKHGGPLHLNYQSLFYVLVVAVEGGA